MPYTAQELIDIMAAMEARAYHMWTGSEIWDEDVDNLWDIQSTARKLLRVHHREVWENLP